MVVGFLKDAHQDISPIVPSVVQKWLAVCPDLLVEHGISTGAYLADSTYEGVTFQDRDHILNNADVIIKVTGDYLDNDFDKMKSGAILVSQFAPFNDGSVVELLNEKKVHAFSLDMIPRTSLAQSMDILSSMASIAGYKAVLSAMNHMPRYMPMMITAAGSIKPSKVLVLGAGVAGLQAIATARRMGAMVEAFDTRIAVKEEVQSLGARFVEVEGATDDAAAGGYAVEQSEEYKKLQGDLIQQKAVASDIVITTAQLRGRPAPQLITERTIELMKPGSVVVDLAASTGGNCACCKDNATITVHDVIIIGDSALANSMPQDASTLYSNNVFNFMKHIINEEAIDLHSDDEILSKSLITNKP